MTVIADAYGGHQNRQPFEAPWLEATTGYRASGEGWELVDADGAITASLTVDRAPEPHPDAADYFTRPPEVTEQLREVLQKPAALPAGLAPATVEEATRQVGAGRPRHRDRSARRVRA